MNQPQKMMLRDYMCMKCGNITQIETNHTTPFRGCRKCYIYGAYLVQQTEEGKLAYAEKISKRDKLRAMFPISIPTLKNQQIEVIIVKDKKVKKKFKMLKLTIKWDDNLDNGHNSFGVMVEKGLKSSLEDNFFSPYDDYVCSRDLIKHFPEYAHLIKYHMLTSDGYFHASNIEYMLNKPEKYSLEDAREYAVWEDATEEQLRDTEALNNHLAKVVLPQLKIEIEKLGMVY